jgi:hypothetical protein
MERIATFTLYVPSSPLGHNQRFKPKYLIQVSFKSKTSLMSSNLGHNTSTPTFDWSVRINPLVRLVYKLSGLASDPPMASFSYRSRKTQPPSRMPSTLNGFEGRLGLSHKHMSLVYGVALPGRLEIPKFHAPDLQSQVIEDSGFPEGLTLS